MKLIKSLIKRLANTNLSINLRNLSNIKPVFFDLKNLHSISISDAFAWRTADNFVTKFKYADILNLFYKIRNSHIELHFYSKENNLIKIDKNFNLDFSNEIVIDSKYLENIEDYGTFYIYHYSDNSKIKDIISNRCYIGYSQNKNLYSFVHGNTYAKFNKISGNKKIDSDIVKTSAFKNHYYKIQKYFENFDKVELFFSNPTSKVIKFSIDKKNYLLKEGCSLLIDVSDQKTINIKSNCLFLRPTVFSYKNNYLDVHHS
jgi:hypothetical protein